MPNVHGLSRRWDGNVEDRLGATLSLVAREAGSLIRRVNVPTNSSSPAGLIEANTRDPFRESGKYGLGWVYFGLILLFFTSMLYCYFAFTDRIRAAWSGQKDEVYSATSTPSDDYEMAAFPYPTDKSTNKLFPRVAEYEKKREDRKTQPTISGWRPLLLLIAAFRMVFYRTIPDLKWHRKFRAIVFPPLSVLFIGFAGVAFSLLYTFVPQPLFWQSIEYGSPPVAIRSGMMAVALLPWVVATAMKANIISVITGIGHERLNVLHRWGAYLMLLLSLIHTVPFYTVTRERGYATFEQLLRRDGVSIYGTGMLIDFVLMVHANRFRNCRPGSAMSSDRTFSARGKESHVRTVPLHALANIRGLCGYDVLALQQLPHLIRLLVHNRCDLAIILARARNLYELLESMAHVMAHRRRISSHTAT